MNCPNCNYALSGNEEECPSCSTAINQALSGRISQKVDNALGPEGFAPVGAKLTKFSNTAKLVVASFILAVEIGLFTFGLLHGLPFYIPPIFILPTIAIIWLTVRSNRKISQIDFRNPEQNYATEMEHSVYKAKVAVKPGTNLFGQDKITLEPGESVLTYLAPIYRMQANFSGPSLVSVERFTENVIAITDQRVMFFTVAMAGQGMLINGASQDYLNSELKRNSIREMVSAKIQELKSGEAIDHFPNDFWIDRASLAQVMYLKGIGPVKYLYAGAMGFRPQGGKKLKYQIVDATNFDEAISLLNAQKKLAI